MDEALLDVVVGRLDRVPLEEGAASLLLAACEGDAALAAELSGEQRQGPERDAARADTEPAGAYLRSVTVSGFRGVGPAATLELEPGPRLTVIVGRNGSGKSSFADGLEVLLTGNLRRWQELSAAWRDSWRNLHAPDPVRLSADLLLEDAGPATADRSWERTAGFAESHATVQVSGEKQTGQDRLGWQDALVTYRPFLSHSELEAFLSGPSHLYDLLSSVLGLEDLTAAEKRLAAARKEREDGLKGVIADLPMLLGRLATIDDERARSCHQALAARFRDLQRALLVATGSPGAQPDGEIGRLRGLCQLTAPAEQKASEAVTVLRVAADDLAKTAGSEAGQALALAKLLGSALAHYHTHGAGPCPVCGRAGALDDQWKARAEQEIGRLRTQAAQAEKADADAAEAQKKARELFLPVPVALTEAPVGAADPQPAREAWAAWAKRPDQDGPDGLRQLADHIGQAWPALSDAVTTLVSSAEGELRAREDQWAPVAKEVVAWCTRAQAAEAGAAVVPAIKRAITWLKNATDDIRNDRLAPRTRWSRRC